MENVKNQFNFENQKTLNKEAKKVAVSLGAIRSIVLKATNEETSPIFVQILEQSTDKDKYKVLQRYCKPNPKSGKYSTWKLIGDIRRNMEAIQNKYIAIDKKAAKAAKKAA